MPSPDLKIEITPYSKNAVNAMDLRPALEQLYLPEVVFADWAIRTGEGAFDAYFRIRDYHCDPLKIPRLRGTIRMDGNTVINSFIIDAEDPEGKPPHTYGHLRELPLFPGNLAIGSIIEGVGYDIPMNLVSVRKVNFKNPGQPNELMTATSHFLIDRHYQKVVNEAVVTINDREHARCQQLVFTPSNIIKGRSLPQYRLFEVSAQMAGAGMQTLIGPLPEDYIVIYDGIGPTSLDPVELVPHDVLKGAVTIFDYNSLGEGSYLFELDAKLFSKKHGEIGKMENISLALLPKMAVLEAIGKALKGRN